MGDCNLILSLFENDPHRGHLFLSGVHMLNKP